MTRSIAELRAAGVVFTASEAVAITQQLIAVLRDPHDGDLVQPPFGPPTPDNVFLGDDGSVVCRGCGATPAVSEVGNFLDSLLADGSIRVPGGLRYTIARALLNVDVPPFDSLDDLSRDLARHERGPRVEWVRGVLARAAGQRPETKLALVDRRRARPSESELRRALREADARLFEQRPPVIVQQIDVQPVPPRSLRPAAACLAAGVLLMCAGEFMHSRHASALNQVEGPIAATHTAAPIVEPARPAAAPADEAPRGESIASVQPPAQRAPARGIIVVRDVPSPPARALRSDPRRVSARRTAVRPAPATIRRQAPRPHFAATESEPSRGVLDRLRLGWLRGAFAARSAL
jgi:hypothetical protein